MKKKGQVEKKGSCLGRLLRLFLALLVLAIVVSGSLGALLFLHYQRFEQTLLLEEGQTQTMVIPPNTPWPGVVERVAAAGLVEKELYFDIWGRRSGLSGEVRAGSFELEGPLSLEEFASILRQGGLAGDVQITFPEGLTIFHMADRLEAAGLATRAEFLELVRQPEHFGFAPELETLEGYLYPDTYRFFQGSSAEQIVERLLGRWQQMSAPLFEEHREALQELEERYGLTDHDIVILASLIERETGSGDERDMIARVFYNRLDRGMMLQTDPTCVYGEATYLEIPSPARCRDPLNRYSTYVIKGLPPGPIANPSQAAIRAALLPSQSPEAMEYLYFVARRDGSGGHYFSRTYDEHRRAIRRFLQNK